MTIEEESGGKDFISVLYYGRVYHMRRADVVLSNDPAEVQLLSNVTHNKFYVTGLEQGTREV